MNVMNYIMDYLMRMDVKVSNLISFYLNGIILIEMRRKGEKSIRWWSDGLHIVFKIISKQECNSFTINTECCLLTKYLLFKKRYKNTKLNFLFFTLKQIIFSCM